MTDRPLRYRPENPLSWWHRDPARSNQYCLYCGRFVGAGSTLISDREHLIARNFVPTGKLHASSFNFIFRACRECNDRKGDAERHVSSVTLLNSPRRLDDPAIDQIARRKGSGDYSPTGQGIRIGEEVHRHTIEFAMQGATLGFEMVAPPQLDPERAGLLAFHQIQALFSMVTTTNLTDPQAIRILPIDQWHQLGLFEWRDWGNPWLRTLEQRTKKWREAAIIDTAYGYFKAVLRRGSDEEGWFWALEWNQCVRVAGCIARPKEIPTAFRDLPQLPWQLLPDGKGRIREEVPLVDGEDTLFRFDDDDGSQRADV